MPPQLTQITWQADYKPANVTFSFIDVYVTQQAMPAF